MRDIYLYEGTDVLKNLLNIHDKEELEEAESGWNNAVRNMPFDKIDPLK